MGKPENPEAQYRAKKINLIWHRVSASAAYTASLKEKRLSSFCNGEIIIVVIKTRLLPETSLARSCNPLLSKSIRNQQGSHDSLQASKLNWRTK